LARFRRFLEQDPNNLSLLGDAAAAAFDDRAFDLAAELIDRYAAITSLPPPIENLAGLAALAREDFASAATIFSKLRGEGHDDPGLRFNLAWAQAVIGAHAAALNLLDDATLAVSPRAPALKIQMMHHLGQFEDALACGQGLAERYPDNQALMGALATLAIDAEETDLAFHYARLAGDHAEGLAALGILTLGDQDSDAAIALFDRALAAQPTNPRAWVGKGLGLLSAGDSAEAAAAIDRGAELFGSHLGSWVAAGWAHFVGGRLDTARERFEHVVALDPNFAEGHGGLAVLAVLDGRGDDARRHSEVALRLDRQSLGGALAKSLLLDRSGDRQSADRIRQMALSAPVGPNGQTIAQALAGFSSGLRK
jgi:tetratricopeptide (TPR) repeat protein